MTSANYDGPRLLPVTSAAKLLGISKTALRDWCRDGLIPCLKSGNKYYINMVLVLEWVDRESRKGCSGADTLDADRPGLEALA